MVGIISLFAISIVSTVEWNDLIQITKTNYYNHPNLVVATLSLQLGKINVYLEHKFEIRNSEWIAGPAKPVQ